MKESPPLEGGFRGMALTEVIDLKHSVIAFI
jgi:hypothetical protein